MINELNEITLESMCEFYNSNKDFHDYVERFSKSNNIGIVKSMRHSIVKEAYIMYNDNYKNKSK